MWAIAVESNDALAASREWAAESGALAVHAYEQVETLLGQGTVGLELEDQDPNVDTLLVAVGGGGLIGGMAAWYAGAAEVISIEPESCPTLHDALRAGRPVDAPVGGIAADSLGARQVGSQMFEIAQHFVTDALVVPDAAIVAAQRALWEHCRVIAEPGGATALAGLLSGAFVPSEGAHVGALVCGGNTDPAKVVELPVPTLSVLAPTLTVEPPTPLRSLIV